MNVLIGFLKKSPSDDHHANFGVNFVFDILDTEGPDLPNDVLKFTAKGEISKVQMSSMQETLRRSQIECIGS